MIAKIILVTEVTYSQVIGPRGPSLSSSCVFFEICMEPDFVVAKYQARIALSLSPHLPIPPASEIPGSTVNSGHDEASLGKGGCLLGWMWPLYSAGLGHRILILVGSQADDQKEGVPVFFPSLTPHLPPPIPGRLIFMDYTFLCRVTSGWLTFSSECHISS